MVPTEAMKRKQVLEDKPFLGEVLDSKGQQALEAKELLPPLQYADRERERDKL